MFGSIFKSVMNFTLDTIKNLVNSSFDAIGLYQNIFFIIIRFIIGNSY